MIDSSNKQDVLVFKEKVPVILLIPDRWPWGWTYKTSKRRRKKLLTAALICFIIAGATVLVYWIVEGMKW